MAYKYVNTCYKDLFDSSTASAIVTNDGFLVNYNSSYISQFVKEINSDIATKSIYIKFTSAVSASNLALIMNIQTLNGASNLTLYASSTQLKLTNYNSAFTWTKEVPSTSFKLVTSEFWANMYKRDIIIHFDTVANHADLYSDGKLYASISCANNGEYIRRLSLGALDASAFNTNYGAIKDVIISDTEIPLTEKITDVTPIIASTDWTVNNGVATTDVVGGTMTLTPPSNAIDETKKTITGYSSAFIDCVSSETINSVTVTQGATSQQVSIPTSGSRETKNTFPVTQLSDILATVTASYTTP